MIITKFSCDMVLIYLFVVVLNKSENPCPLQRLHSESGEVKVRRLVLDLVFIFPLLLGHVLDVEDGSPLRVVEARRPVEHTDEE